MGDLKKAIELAEIKLALSSAAGFVDRFTEKFPSPDATEVRAHLEIASRAVESLEAQVEQLRGVEAAAREVVEQGKKPHQHPSTQRLVRPLAATLATTNPANQAVEGEER